MKGFEMKTNGEYLLDSSQRSNYARRMNELLSWGIIVGAVLGLLALGFAALQVVTSSEEFWIAKGFFLLAAFIAAGRMILWGTEAPQSLTFRLVICFIVCGLIGVFAVQGTRYINRKRARWASSHTAPEVAATKADETPQQTQIPEITNVRLVIESVSPEGARFHYEIENGEIPIKILRTMEETPQGYIIENILPGGAREIARRGKLAVAGVDSRSLKEDDYNEVGLQLLYSTEIGGVPKNYLYSCRFLIQPGSLQPSAAFYPVHVSQKPLTELKE